jgi:5-deoxy-glucuronate isomerase
MSIPALDPNTCVIRGTDRCPGRTRTVTPRTSATRQLHYGRIILGAADGPLAVDPGDHETGLVALKGSGTVVVGRDRYDLVPYDALYLPAGTRFEVVPGPEGVDLAELSAQVDGRYAVQFVRFEDVQKDPGLHFRTGGSNSERVVNLLIAKNVNAGRIMAGVTFSEPGHWTSWPPHEHTAMLEEAYLYVAMPAPAFGVQLVYGSAGEPELAAIVREGDVVVMPQGYHPNVAAPGCRIGFLWMMAAHREGIDRQFGVVSVQPEFASLGSGLDKGRAK